MTKKQEEESACERVPEESEGKPDEEQELVEEIESFNDALSKIGKTAQEATDSLDQFHKVWEQEIESLNDALSEIGKTAQEAADSWDQFHKVWEQAIEAVAKKLAEKFAKIEREETNNWRKLHGKPMRRRGGWHGRI